MMTQSHLIFGLAAFGRPGDARVTAAALAGAIVPDLSLYLMAGWHLQVLETPPGVVFGQLYYSESWQSIFRIDNSFVLWALALVLSAMAGSRVAMALCAAALLHLSLDFPLHNDDARAHFWPISDWKFISPVSYWDDRHFGHLIGPLEILMSLGISAWLWRRFRGRGMRALVAGLAALQAAAGIGLTVAWLT